MEKIHPKLFKIKKLRQLRKNTPRVLAEMNAKSALKFSTKSSALFNSAADAIIESYSTGRNPKMRDNNFIEAKKAFERSEACKQKAIDIYEKHNIFPKPDVIGTLGLSTKLNKEYKKALEILSKVNHKNINLN